MFDGIIEVTEILDGDACGCCFIVGLLKDVISIINVIGIVMLVGTLVNKGSGWADG